MKKSELKQLIKEEIVKILTENENYFQPTHISKVDWYLVDDSSHKGGEMVPHDPKYKAPKGEILIHSGDKVMKVRNEMENEEGTRVEYKTTFFEKL